MLFGGLLGQADWSTLTPAFDFAAALTQLQTSIYGNLAQFAIFLVGLALTMVLLGWLLRAKT